MIPVQKETLLIPEVNICPRQVKITDFLCEAHKNGINGAIHYWRMKCTCSFISWWGPGMSILASMLQRYQMWYVHMRYEQKTVIYQQVLQSMSHPTYRAATNKSASCPWIDAHHFLISFSLIKDIFYPPWRKPHLSVHGSFMKRHKVVEKAQDMLHAQTNCLITTQSEWRSLIEVSSFRHLSQNDNLPHASGPQRKCYDLCPSQ